MQQSYLVRAHHPIYKDGVSRSLVELFRRHLRQNLHWNIGVRRIRRVLHTNRKFSSFGLIPVTAKDIELGKMRIDDEAKLHELPERKEKEDDRQARSEADKAAKQERAAKSKRTFKKTASNFHTDYVDSQFNVIEQKEDDVVRIEIHEDLRVKTYMLHLADVYLTYRNTREPGDVPVVKAKQDDSDSDSAMYGELEPDECHESDRVMDVSSLVWVDVLKSFSHVLIKIPWYFEALQASLAGGHRLYLLYLRHNELPYAVNLFTHRNNMPNKYEDLGKVMKANPQSFILIRGSDIPEQVKDVMNPSKILAHFNPISEFFNDPKQPYLNDKSVKPNEMCPTFSVAAVQVFEDYQYRPLLKTVFQETKEDAILTLNQIDDMTLSQMQQWSREKCTLQVKVATDTDIKEMKRLSAALFNMRIPQKLVPEYQAKEAALRPYATCRGAAVYLHYEYPHFRVAVTRARESVEWYTDTIQATAPTARIAKTHKMIAMFNYQGVVILNTGVDRMHCERFKVVLGALGPITSSPKAAVKDLTQSALGTSGTRQPLSGTIIEEDSDDEVKACNEKYAHIQALGNNLSDYGDAVTSADGGADDDWNTSSTQVMDNLESNSWNMPHGGVKINAWDTSFGISAWRVDGSVNNAVDEPHFQPPPLPVTAQTRDDLNLTEDPHDNCAEHDRLISSLFAAFQYRYLTVLYLKYRLPLHRFPYRGMLEFTMIHEILMIQSMHTTSGTLKISIVVCSEKPDPSDEGSSGSFYNLPGSNLDDGESAYGSDDGANRGYDF
ncbi:hypothetical protein N0V83_008277 [Neocucurbitaria cava]|uniref:Uncharacterized protein n=1 Tax=Neocucurbitaria cava TaxID=798079 RepID=A0A9W8Y392_9PLEO|nr:hypothetical protein N0V83_008277 [Neocucurbitaria cava]